MTTITEYHRPGSVDEALRLLARSSVTTVPIGGGSQLAAQRGRDVEAVVDLRDLGLSYVRGEGNALRVGATTTLQTLIDSPDSVGAWNGELAQVTRLTAARNLREQGTIAGTLVSAEGNNPLAVLLLALDATLTIVGSTNQIVALDTFFKQPRSRLAGSLITEIGIPLPQLSAAAAFERVSRTPADLPIVCAAVRAQIEKGVVRDIRIGLGGVGSNPIRAPRIEQMLKGSALDDRSIEITDQDIDPPSDFLGSSEYRREMASVLVQRALKRVRRAT